MPIQSKKFPVHLTAMQFEFCSQYINNGFNATQAALDAGYSPIFATTKASRLLDNPTIKQRVTKAFVRAEDKLGITWEKKLLKLWHVVEQFIPDTPLTNAHHVKIGLQAMAELNKMAGDYAPEKRLSMTVDATQDKLNQSRIAYKEY